MRPDPIRPIGRLLAALALLAAPAAAQDGVMRERVGGSVWRIDGAIDVILAQDGPDGLLLVDTGYPFAEAGVRAALREIAGTDSVRLLLVTHPHHAFSNHLYGAGAEIVAQERAAHRLAGGYLMAGQVVPPATAAARPTRVFADSLRLRWNGEDVTLLHLPSAHTDGDAAVFFHGSNVVATGDVYVPHMPWLSVDQGAHVEGLLAALDLLLARIPEDARIVPGHDRVTASKRDLRAFRAMIAEAADTVRTRMEAGLSLRAIQTLGLPGLAAWRGDAVPESLFLESLYRSFVRARTAPGAGAVELVDGRWWDGSAFVARTMWTVEGVLRERRPARVDRVVDLAGGWVVPPFGEAHTHAFGDTARLAEDARRLTRAGVLYAMVQDPLGPVAAPKRALAADPRAPDVAFTQGVITPSWGLIARMYARFAESGFFGPEVAFDDVDGDLVFRLDRPADVDAAWPAILERNDRFLKVIVAFADELDARRADPDRYRAEAPHYSALPGVTPAVLRTLVERAHRDGLRVSAHIETAADFRLAVDAGADLIAHMPAAWQVGGGTGYPDDDPAPWLLTPEDARAARRAGTVVVTTLGARAPGHPLEPLFRRIHEHNLRLLADAGVTLAIGSDAFDGTVVDEALYLRSLGALTDLALFRLLATQTPRVIFPDLRIGHLRDGWEASFLVLGGDPTADLERIRDVRQVYRRGVALPDP